MRSRPIIFSAPMVLAILEGRKTQTRRIIDPQPDAVETAHFASGKRACQPYHILRCYNPPARFKPCASGWSVDCPGPFRVVAQPGDHLWVRETWRTSRSLDHCKPSGLANGAPIQYEADKRTNINNHERGPLIGAGRIRQSIYMRQWMSRINLDVSAVRVERLQDISEHDAKAEGVKPMTTDFVGEGHAISCYRDLWQSIHGRDSWDANPYVWVIEFKPI